MKEGGSLITVGRTSAGHVPRHPTGEGGAVFNECGSLGVLASSKVLLVK